MNPKHLYTPTDVQKARQSVLLEQGGVDVLTGLEIPQKQAVLDHNHKTQFVRGVLHRQSNACLGKIENLWTRYLSYWYPHDLQTFLRQSADYLDRPDDTRYLHPGWIKRCQVEFNKLNVQGKKQVLHHLGVQAGSNDTERKKLFKKAIMQKEHSFDFIIEKIKEQQ